jgi:hypothetical protein
MTFPQATLTGHFATDLVVIAVSIGVWYLFHIWKLTQDREIRRKMRRRPRPYSTETIVANLRSMGISVRKVGPMSAVQGLDLPDDEASPQPTARGPVQQPGSSLDSILKPSRKYRLPEAE